MLSSIAMKKKHKTSLAVARETLRVLQHAELTLPAAGLGSGSTNGFAKGNTCCSCQDTHNPE